MFLFVSTTALPVLFSLTTKPVQKRIFFLFYFIWSRTLHACWVYEPPEISIMHTRHLVGSSKHRGSVFYSMVLSIYKVHFHFQPLPLQVLKNYPCFVINLPFDYALYYTQPQPCKSFSISHQLNNNDTHFPICLKYHSLAF